MFIVERLPQAAPRESLYLLSKGKVFRCSTEVGKQGSSANRFLIQFKTPASQTGRVPPPLSPQSQVSRRAWGQQLGQRGLATALHLRPGDPWVQRAGIVSASPADPKAYTILGCNRASHIYSGRTWVTASCLSRKQNKPLLIMVPMWNYTWEGKIPTVRGICFVLEVFRSLLFLGRSTCGIISKY